MAEMTRVALDAMGGDNAPECVVQGAVDAVGREPKLKVYLLGLEEPVREELDKTGYKGDQIELIGTTEVIEMAEPPVNAIRSKKDSSIVVGMKMVKNGEADAFVSAGSTGAILVGGQTIIGRIRGVRRPPFAPLIPTQKGVSLLIDSGANVDAKPGDLVQFAKMGSIYMEDVMGVKNPTVGILNIGAEEEKGNALVKETFPLLKTQEDINFVGSAEARDVPFGIVDVVVCEGFAGNIFLKTYEGTGALMKEELTNALKSNLRSELGAALALPAINKALKKYSSSEHGGAPMLGIKGLVVKTHGSSKAQEVSNTLLQSVTFKDQKIIEKIEASIQVDPIAAE